MTEDNVVDTLAEWLGKRGCQINRIAHGTQRGDDVDATLVDGRSLFVECKGAVSKHGNPLGSWECAAMAFFGAIKQTEELRPSALHAIAIPDTGWYRKTIAPLHGFCARQRITVFWVQPDGHVLQEGARIGALEQGE
jgi:hypothetical protein